MPSNTDQVMIFDTTLRDGEQSPGCSMTQAEKLRVAKALAELGVDIIEAGFPAASQGDWEAVNAVGRLSADSRVAIATILKRWLQHSPPQSAAVFTSS